MTAKSASVPAVSVGFVSLGCAKNLVDLQIMAGQLVDDGVLLARSAEEADIILVNTCAFIDDAREEAASEIVWACDRKAAGLCRAVVVTGCLPQRYHKRMLKAFPGVDAVLGVDDLDQVADIVRQLAAGAGRLNAVSPEAPHRLFEPGRPDLVLTGGPFAYLKVAEGCNHACAFCAIPGIRGGYRSRSVERLVAEARSLLAAGYREINLISQDIMAYGRDLRDGSNLVTLLRELDQLDGDYWLRLLYGYPLGVTDELLEWMVGSRHACHYLDIPFQHSHPDILRAMRRAETIPLVAGLPQHLRTVVPDITLRTTFLVGFPGESEDHFRHLMDYTAASRFDHLGVFAFSPEEGTAAANMGDEPDDVVAEERRDALLQQQAGIVRQRLAALVGREETVYLEQPYIDDEGSETGWWSARSQAQAPEDVDGITLVDKVPDGTAPGSFARVRHIGQTDYDSQAVFLELI